MSKYLLKLVSYSLVLGILPTLLIGFASYSIASRDMEKKVKEVNMQWLAQTQMRVEQMLKSTEKSATQFANSSLVKASMNTSLSSSDFESVRELTQELYNLQSSDAIITQAYLVNLEQNWALNLNVMKPLNQFENRQEFMDNAKQPKSIFWYTGLSASNADNFYEPVETITLVHKIPILPQTDKPQGLLVVNIIASEIHEALELSSNTSDRNYILNRTGADILGSDSNKKWYEEINLAVVNQLESDPEQQQGILNTRLDGKEVAVLYSASNYNSWTYISVVAVGELKKETKKIAGLTMLVCLTILLIVVAVAMYGSRRMYRPIGNLLNVARELDSSNLDQRLPRNRDDLEFIKCSIQSLAGSRDRLEQQIIGQTSHLKEFFVLKLFTGQISENDNLFRSDIYGFPAGWRRLGVLALQIDNLQETRCREEDRELLLYAVSNIAQEVLPASLRFPPITLSQSQVTLIATELEDTEAVRNILYEAAECIKTNAEKYLQIQVSIGISNPFLQLTDTVKALGESLYALKARISLGPEIIVHYGDIENHSHVDHYEYSHLKMLEKRVVYAIKEMQPNSATELLGQYLDTLLYKDRAIYEHQTLLLQLASRLLRIVQEQGVSIKRVLKDEGAIEKIFHLQTREEIIHWFESKWFGPIIELLSENAKIQYVKIADRLVNMIQEQYDQEITLESFSKILNYHPFYLSRIFKREIGIPFSDYLTDYRMKMAKVMLETTDMKLSEISEKLRYKNISSFIRSYKKTYQVTPGRYRENMMKGARE
ncbi:AraC family transcriptional regulator [Paenibacillus donghaensis]|uniref:AraC family transcriptional regulator n=1 Tax=Paenibacillus donghaensis TaxID=414771 RepID=A0A2Z2KJC5_9BACL|nr:AraC family transcriptional regulator [Paenibacillus donghaensis]ASA22409.1 AraC family transcriptional regulator [Paenibacillus donghaensis]